MKLTGREKVLLPVFPAAIVLLTYSQFFAPSLKPAREAYTQAIAKQVSSLDLSRQQSAVARLQRDVAGLEKEKAKLDRQKAEVRGEAASPSRHAHERQLNALLVRHNLELVEESPPAKGGAAKLPNSVVEAMRPMGDAQWEKSAQVRSLRFAGKFMDVLAAVQELTQAESPPGIPISLSMAEANLLGDRRTWTLLVWM